MAKITIVDELYEDGITIECDSYIVSVSTRRNIESLVRIKCTPEDAAQLASSAVREASMVFDQIYGGKQ